MDACFEWSQPGLVSTGQILNLAKESRRGHEIGTRRMRDRRRNSEVESVGK